MSSQAQDLLQNLNLTYTELHKRFEELFWIFKMGDHSVEDEMNQAEKARDLFRSDVANLNRTKEAIATPSSTNEEREKLQIWQNFFKLYQTPSELTSLRDKIAVLEGRVAKKFATRIEGYQDPKTGEFMPASKGKMRMMMKTNPDEAIRKACFNALEEMSLDAVGEYAELVAMRNQFARSLGHKDFYAYKLKISEGMTKDEVFDVFEEIYKKLSMLLWP